MQSRDCSKCTSPMTEGFITDQGHGMIVVPKWVDGPPRKSAWVGVRIGGRKRTEVSTWRCRRCGFLESYAADEPNLAEEVEMRSQVKILLIGLLIVTAIALAVIAALSVG